MVRKYYTASVVGAWCFVLSLLLANMPEPPVPLALSLLPPSRPAPAPDWVKIEKNLAALGFFTPSSKRIKGAAHKTVVFGRRSDGHPGEASTEILPDASFGLPITADQDKYLALQKIIADTRRQQGALRNPIGFTSAELLRLLGRRVTAGKNYDDIAQWLQRMTKTRIHSEGTVYLAGRRSWLQGEVRVFERAVSFGTPLPDGRPADRNYVWLSAWQLENIQHNHLMAVDLAAYRSLRNHIAKTLVPLLQTWLAATHDEGVLIKSYAQLCQTLHITRYQQPSKILEKLAPSLDELQAARYFSSWSLDKGSPSDPRLVIYHRHAVRLTPGALAAVAR
ncbi:MAG: replication initiator protein A [Bryobacterales bacterium]|nr:replication initiator protein A [Bryobacterales bacterium]